MEAKVFVSLWLDTRRKAKNGKFPVRLRVFRREPRQQKLYETAFAFSEDVFEKIYNVSRRPKADNLVEDYYTIQAYQQAAEDIAKLIVPFDFSVFERRFFKRASTNDIIYHYENLIKKLREDHKINTAVLYELSLKSLKEFFAKNYKAPDTILFSEIKPETLRRYERSMTEAGRSATTISMYLRVLRRVFNKAIKEGDIDKAIYPFGQYEDDKYSPPAHQNVKKALTSAELKTLRFAEAHTPEQEKARDFWFFSYFSNGMNIKDITRLKWADMEDDSFTFFRAKTMTGSGTKTKVRVYLNEFTRAVIEKYGNQDRSKEYYVFPILLPTDTPEEAHRKVQNFTRFINQHFKKIADKEGIKSNVGTYAARHSFSSHLIRKGGTMELAMQSLGHNNMKTTMNYFAGFEDESVKEIMGRLEEF